MGGSFLDRSTEPLTPETAETSFARATTASPVGDGDFAVAIDPDWSAFRGPHGGYLAAVILRALQCAVDDHDRPVRSLTVRYLQVAKPGPARVRTTVERSGRSLVTLSARLEQDGQVVALASAAFSPPWPGAEIGDVPMPVVDPPDPRPGSRPARVEATPFRRQMVMQPRIGPAAFSGAEGSMEVGGWMGAFEEERVDAPMVAMFCDGWWPPAFVRMAEPMGRTTIDLSIHFRRPLPQPEADPGELCMTRFGTGLVREGFCDIDAVVWSGSGAVLAEARHLALLLGPRPGVAWGDPVAEA